jgi:hypothetical protein
MGHTVKGEFLPFNVFQDQQNSQLVPAYRMPVVTNMPFQGKEKSAIYDRGRYNEGSN